MLAARYRLGSLWISQVSRSLAGTCLGVFIVLRISQLRVEAAWFQTTAAFLAPLILLSPVSGALNNTLSKRWMLVSSPLLGLSIAALVGVAGADVDEPWIWFVGMSLVGMGHALDRPARYALLPAAAQDTGLPLNRVVGWIDMGCVSGMLGGLMFGCNLDDIPWPGVLNGRLVSPMAPWHFPAAVAAAVGCDGIAMLAAVPAYFCSDVRRPASVSQAFAGYFRDSKLLLEDHPARDSLVGLAYFLSLIAAAFGVVFASAPGLFPLLLGGMGAAGGCLLAAVQGHPRRMLGLVPPTALGMAAALGWTAIDSTATWAWLLLGFLGGTVTVPLGTNFLLAVPAEARGNGMALKDAVTYLSMGVLFLLTLTVSRLGILTPAEQLGLLAMFAAVGALLAWRLLLREAIEQLGEIILWPMYRIRAHGPGRSQIPLRGPLLIIANHTAWFDPLWLAKVLPRRLTAMMTSRFFDLPFLYWLMRNVAGAIRVPATPFRREAPELLEAVAALDGGGCVLIFPEGAMRRRKEELLRHFGQGVWRILRQRPTTPVVVCWIEGGWGSFTSYDSGPPTVNKHLDWRRQIDIAVDALQTLDPALLADHHATRNYLLRACLGARRHLRLQPLPEDEKANEHPGRGQYEDARRDVRTEPR